MKIQDALDLHLKEEASRIIGEYIRAANAGLPSYDTSRDYSGRLLALTVLPYSFLLKLKPTAIVASV